MLNRLVHNFDLSISLRLRDRREDLLNLEVVVELLEFIVVELCSIIRYDGMRDSILAYDVLVDELLDLCVRYRRELLCFNPFTEIVDCHYCALYTTSSFGESTD